MKAIVGLAVAAALSVSAAHASIVMPGTGTGELIEWVVDTSTNQVYARGINVSEQTILPASVIQSGTTYDPTTAPVLTGTSLPTIAPDANLTTFLAQDGGTDHFQFAVLGAGQGTGGATTIAPGGNVVVFSSPLSVAASTLTPPLTSTLAGQVLNVQNTVTTLNSLIGGTPGDGGSANVTGNFVPTSGEFSLYAFNTQLLSDVGSDQSLYALTGDNVKTKFSQLYTTGQITMTANGTLESVGGGTTPPPPPVPLPAAIWLLGSGLLGLAGVGRRKSA